MNIRDKEKIFENSCQKLLQKEVLESSKNIDSEIERQIKNEIQEYQEKEELTYNKKIEKLEKDFNKQIYNYEMECKKEILNTKKELQKDIRRQVENILKDFSNTVDYEEFLMLKISETIRKLPNCQNSNLYLTEKDLKKFGERIKIKYNITIKTIEELYIGGCILEDNVIGMYIDNTILNSINEQFENN